jgi:LytS/YehU family sensor histidine kinase
VRFGARLQVETDVADAAAGVEVPALLLQPLVENAVRHGVAGLIEGGTVRITAERAGSQVVVTVVNPRDPDAPVRRGTSLGLSIVRRRLAAAFADAGSLLIDATDEQFRAVVTIPGGAEGDARE